MTAEQAAILSELSSRLSTATGWTELFTAVGGVADDRLLELIATLEALGLAAKKTTKDFEAETYALIATGKRSCICIQQEYAYQTRR